MGIAQKLNRPPYAHNWVRYVKGSELETRKALVAFARSMPQITYKAGNQIIQDRVLLQLDRDTAMKVAQQKGRPNSRANVAEYVSAFFDYDLSAGISSRPAFDEVVEPFRVGKGVVVPVKPLVTTLEAGEFQPIFSVGWASNPLSTWQHRLLATIFEDAVFSLADFRRSHGRFLTFPRREKRNPDSRYCEMWQRGDFELLSRTELRDTLELYLEALQNAKLQLVAEEIPVRPSSGDREVDHPRLL